MKRSEIFFGAIQLPIDALMIALAAASAFVLRDVLPRYIAALPPRVFDVPIEQFAGAVLVAIPIVIIVYAVDGLYAMRATRSLASEVWAVLRATTIALVVIIVAIFLNREWFSSRTIILMAWVLVIVYVSAARIGMRMVQTWLVARRLIGVHRLLLIGDTRVAHAIRRYAATHPRAGYRVVGRLDTPNLRKIKALCREDRVDEIIVCDPSVPDTVVEKLLDYCKINNIVLRIVPTSLQASLYEFATIAGEPMLVFVHTPLDGWGRVLKRVFDIVASGVAIILTLPLMAVIALLIKWEDPDGPVVFKNERIGSNGKKFFVYKFRYMKWKYSISRDNPRWREALAFEQKLIKERSVRKGPIYKIKDDPRKTRIGAFIERYSLDELPQFFNVLFGSMSLVGPRPHQEREVAKYKEYHRQLLTIKPGLTGMAQVNGRSDLDFEDEYKLDVFYIEHWSLWLDIVICLKTAGVLFARRKNNS